MAIDFVVAPVRWELFPLAADHSLSRDWLTFQSQRGLSRNTLDAYCRGLEIFLRFLAAHQLMIPAVTRAHIGAYLASMQSERTAISNATVQQRITVLRLFYGHLVDEGLCGLRTDDIDPSSRMFRIRAETTKGRRDRVVPYSATTGTLLQQYLFHRKVLSRSRGPLFLSESRRNYAVPVSIWSWSKIVLAIARRADVRRFTTHTLRHLCLTDLARAGWDIHEIAAFAGRRSIQTTLLYIHLSGRDLSRKLAIGMAHIHARRVAMLTEGNV